METWNSPWQNKISIVYGANNAAKADVANRIAEKIKTQTLTVDQIIDGVIMVDVDPQTEVLIVRNVFSGAILKLYQVFCSAPGVAVNPADKPAFLLENIKQIVLITTQTGINAFPLEDYYKRGINVFRLPDDTDTVETVLSIIASKD